MENRIHPHVAENPNRGLSRQQLEWPNPMVDQDNGQGDREDEKARRQQEES